MEEVDNYLSKNNFKLENDNFSQPQGSLRDHKATDTTYDIISTEVIDDKDKNIVYRKVVIPLPNEEDYHLKIKNFVYITGSNPLFGGCKGYFQKENEFYLYLYNYSFNCSLLEEFCRKGSRRNGLMKSETIFYLVACLEYLHSMDITYRFVRPESIVYNDGEPFFTTFGYSSSILNCKKSLLKEYNYNTPLNIINSGDLDCSFSSDVYAFGILLNQMIVFNNQPQTVNNVSFKNCKCEKLKSLFKECFYEDPDERPTFSKILKDLLSFKEPLFEGCDMDTYNEYCKKILKLTYYDEEISINDDEPRKLYIYASRKINALNEDYDIDRDLYLSNFVRSEKEIIEKYLEKSAQSKFLPAIYKYSCYLNSELVPKDEPIKYMKEAADCGIPIAYYKCGQMYDQIGDHKSAIAAYQRGKNHGDQMCNLKCLEEKIRTDCSNDDINELNKMKSIKDSNISEEAKLFDAIRQFKGYGCEISKPASFVIPETLNNANNEIIGRAHYLYAVIRHLNVIPIEIEQNSNTFLVFKDECDETCIEHLEKATEAFYEPATAEYVIILVKKRKIDEAKKVLQRYFKHTRCKHDYSKIRIQYAYAKYLEANNQIKKSLSLYKNCADKGIPESCDDYIRIYKEQDSHMNSVVSYYEKRAKNLRANDTKITI